MSEGSRISLQKRHCQCCVYLDTLLNKLQKVADIAYTPSIPEIDRKITPEGDPPPFYYAVFRGVLDGTQYAKGRYAVRKNPVISYADIDFYFKRPNFHQETKQT